MSRLGVVFALSALCLVVAVNNKPESSSINPPTQSTPALPPISTTTPESSTNKTKDGVGQGHGRRRNDYGDHHERRPHHSRYESDEEDDYGYDIHPHSRVKPYFDTHYCSVHGSFRLAYNEKVEKKESGYGGENYQQSPSNYGGGYQQTGYGNQGGENAYGGGYQQPGYGNKGGEYGKGHSYKKDKPHFVRKVTRQYCRYAAAWSEKACKFCCKVVARSAYTNPDDIIAAIFSFDPASPASGGAGVERYHEKSGEYEKSPAYGAPKGYESQGGYGQQPSYGQNNYENQGNNYNGGNSYNQPAYSPAPYGAGPYRSKRNSGYSPASTYSAPPPAQSYDQYSQPAEQYPPQGDQYSATPEAYSTKPDYGNKYESSGNAIKQCVCCAPKHRYY